MFLLSQSNTNPGSSSPGANIAQHRDSGATTLDLAKVITSSATTTRAVNSTQTASVLQTASQATGKPVGESEISKRSWRRSERRRKGGADRDCFSLPLCSNSYDDEPDGSSSDSSCRRIHQRYIGSLHFSPEDHHRTCDVWRSCFDGVDSHGNRESAFSFVSSSKSSADFHSFLLSGHCSTSSSLLATLGHGALCVLLTIPSRISPSTTKTRLTSLLLRYVARRAGPRRSLPSIYRHRFRSRNPRLSLSLFSYSRSSHQAHPSRVFVLSLQGHQPLHRPHLRPLLVLSSSSRASALHSRHLPDRVRNGRSFSFSTPSSIVVFSTRRTSN